MHRDLHHSGLGRVAEPALWAAPAAWLGLACGVWLGGAAVADALAFARPLIERGQWWRLVTCNFVHLGGWHLFLDALGLLLWVWLCQVRMGVATWLLRTLALALGVGLGLYLFVPGVAGYVGLSGMIYGLLVLDLGHDAIVDKDGFAAFCVAVIVARVAWAMSGPTPAWERALIGGDVIGAAHVCGMVAGALYAAVALGWQWFQHCRSGSDFRLLGRDW